MEPYCCPMTNELIEDTLDDLRHLRAVLNSDPSKGDVRRTTATMRRLLIDDCLGQVWTLLGKPGLPDIQTSRFLPGLGGVPIGNVELATASGFTGGNGPSMFSMSIVRGDHGPMTEPVTLPLDRYMLETMMIVDGARVRRKQVIRYIANKQRGVHHDEDRGKRRWEMAFPYLDTAFQQYKVIDSNVVMRLLQGLGQELTVSPDIAAIID